MTGVISFFPSKTALLFSSCLSFSCYYCFHSNLDTGWYRVDYSLSEPLRYGMDKGCDFVEKQCSLAIWGNDMFCTVPGENGCDGQRQAKSRCNLCNTYLFASLEGKKEIWTGDSGEVLLVYFQLVSWAYIFGSILFMLYMRISFKGICHHESYCRAFANSGKCTLPNPPSPYYQHFPNPRVSFSFSDFSFQKKTIFITFLILSFNKRMLKTRKVFFLWQTTKKSEWNTIRPLPLFSYSRNPSETESF